MCNKSSYYHGWHHHKHHKKVHWATLALFVFAVGALIYNGIPHRSKAAYTFQASWNSDAAINSQDLSADSGSGSLTATNDGTPAEVVTPGSGGSGGAVKLSYGQTLKYEVADNLNLTRSSIEMKFQLPADLAGGDKTEGKFYSPGKVSYDSTNKVLYVADASNNSIVRMHWNGSAFDSWYSIGSLGSGTWQFNGPQGVAFDSASQVAYVADSLNNRIVRMHWNGSGWDSWLAYGFYGVVADYTQYRGGDDGQLNNPLGIAFDAANQVAYVTDSNNYRIVRMHWNGSGWDGWRTYGSLGSGVNQFSVPSGIAFDSEEQFAYISDVNNNRVVRVHWNDTTHYWDSWSTYDGSDTGSAFSYPWGLNFDTTAKALYVTDGGARIIRSVWDDDSSSWIDSYAYGSSGNGTGEFSGPIGIAVDQTTKETFVADTGNNRIVAMNWDNSTHWSDWYTYGSYDTRGLKQFTSPKAAAYDSAKNVAYVMDSGNARLIRIDHSSNAWNTFSAVGTLGSEAYQFNDVRGTALDSANDVIYAADYGLHRIARIHWNSSTNTWDSWTTYGSYGTDTAAGHLNNPTSVAFDTDAQVLYIVDSGNHRIDRVHWNGSGWDNWSIYGGLGSGAGKFNAPQAIAFDSAADIAYITDTGNQRIVRMHWNGTTWDNWYAYAGSGTFPNPQGIAYNPTTSIAYVVDINASNITRMHWNGTTWDTISTFGTQGTGTNQFYSPTGVTTDSATNTVYVADTNNNRIISVIDNATSWSGFQQNYGDYYKDLLVTNGSNPMILRFNLYTQRFEFYLSQGGRDVYFQSDSITLSKDTWYKVYIDFDSVVGSLNFKLYDAASTELSTLAITRPAWTNPDSIGTYMYIGSEPSESFPNRVLGSLVDDLKIESFDPPPAPTGLTATPSGYSSNRSFRFAWTASSGVGSGDVDSYEYNINGGSWTSVGISTDTGVLGDSSLPVLIKGQNTFSVRAKGVHNNYSSVVSTNFYWDPDSPSIPKNLQVTPATSLNLPSEENNFSFTWEIPDNFQGDASKLVYHYCINCLIQDELGASVVDSNSIITVTATSLVAGPYATKQGLNTIYVVAEGENGVVNWGSYASAPFYVQTPNPGPPLGIITKDTSNKDLAQYEAVLRWKEPQYQGIGIEGYRVYMSSDGTSYTKIDDTHSRNYYFENLESKPYYFKVKAFDSANQESVDSEIVSIIPTGSFTRPPQLTYASLSVKAKPYSATINWTTADEEKKNVHQAQSFVEYGLTPQTIGKENGGLELGDKQLVDNHEITISGLKSNQTKYYFRIVWIDGDGNVGSYEQFDESSPFPTVFYTQDRPTISQPIISNVGLSSVMIDYDTTIESTTEIVYGLSSDNLSMQYKKEANAFVKKHTINLTNLNHSSKYYFAVKGIDVDGDILDIGTVNEFSTLTMPLISGNVQMDQDLNAPTTTYRFSWKTNIKTTSVVYYEDDKGKKMSKSSPDYVTDHSIIVSNLADKSIYNFEVTGIDEHAIEVENAYTTKITTPKDTRAPQIANMTIEVKSSGFGSSQKAQIVVSWETDEPSTSQVAYAEGISGSEYSNKSKEDQALSTSHVVILSELEPSKIYHLQAISKDEAANAGKSQDTTVITGKIQKSVFDIITNSLQKSLGWIFNIFN